MSIWSLIFPRKCVGCREFIAGDSVFCPVCEAKYERMKRAFCKKCGREHVMCRCKATKLAGIDMPIEERHLFAYDSELSRTIIYKLKRKNVASLQKFLAHELVLLSREELKGRGEAVVSYPPRAKSAVREYGFDHAKILAEGVACELGLPLAEAFERGESEKQQKTLSAKEREENVKNAYFAAENADLTGKTLVIIDDVVTSGSTAARLCTLVHEKGCARIVLISAAKT